MSYTRQFTLPLSFSDAVRVSLTLQMRREAEGGQTSVLGSSSPFIAELVCFTVVCVDRKVRHGRKAKHIFIVGNVCESDLYETE